MSILGSARPGSAPFARLTALDLAALAVALVLAIPLLSVCLSLLGGPSATFAHLVATVLPDYIINTLLLGVFVVAGVLIIGVPAAWLVATCEFPWRRFLEAALVLPLAAPAYVLAYAYTDLLDSYGPVQTTLRAVLGVGDYWFPEIRSLPGAALMLVFVLYPYVYLLARARFLSESATAMESARLLGRGPWRSFLTVSLPLARPAIAAGATLALMEAFADYGTVSYFGVPVFTTGIYRAWFSFGDPTGAAQLAALLVGFVALALYLERLARGKARYHETGRRDRRVTPARLTGVNKFAAIAFCALPPIFGFLLPALSLTQLLLEAGAPARDFWRHLINSLTLAILAGIVATAVALVLAFARHERPRGPVAKAVDFVSLGYAAPGAVIAVGVLIPFASFDNMLDTVTRSMFGSSVGLVLTGSIAALLFAYQVRFLAVALQSVGAGLERITPSVGGAARMMSRGNWDALWRVHIPLIAPSALTAALIVFVDVMKELPATLMLRPFNFDTLAVAANNYAADERLGFAAAPSLAIVAAGIIPCILLIRFIASSAYSRSESMPLP